MSKEFIQEKKELRKAIIKERLDLPKAQVDVRSLAITKQLIKLEAFKRAKSLMIYIDFRNEVKTEYIIEEALRQDKKVFLPVTDLKNKRLIPTRIENYPEDLKEGAYGILEPKDGAPVAKPQEIDLVVVPGVGFDEAGNRLGYGGGFYDRFLPQTQKETFFTALAYELQIKNNVYDEKHDQPVHLVITEERVIKNI